MCPNAISTSAAQEPDLDPTLARSVAAAWATLIGQADSIADGITLTLIEREREFYDRTGPAMQVDVRNSTREHVRLGIESMAGSQEARVAARELWRDTGRRRARQGVPMGFVLSAYTLGTRVMWEALLAQGASGRIDATDLVLLTAGQRVWSALDTQNAVLIESYRRESARLERRDLQRQQGILDALIEGRGADPAFAAEAREALGLDAETEVACLVAPYDGALEASFVPPEDRLEQEEIASHWHVRGGVSFGLLAGAPGDDGALADLLAPYATGRAGVAISPEGLAGFATAYQLASRAADTVPRGTRDVVAVSRRLPEVLLAGSPEVAALLTQETLGALTAQSEHLAETLCETLAALLRHDGSPKRAAEELFCHRNTVIYRMKQIEELTGRSLTDPRDKLMLALGLMAAGH